MSFIAEFSSDIRHIKGDRNIVADALSRPSVITPPAITSVSTTRLPGIDFKAMARAQDPSSAKDTSLILNRVLWNGVSLWCDVTQGVRPLVPVTFRRAVFEALHGLSH